MKNTLILLAIIFFVAPAITAPKTAPKNLETTAIDDDVEALKDEVTNGKTQMVILKELIKNEGLDGKKRKVLVSFSNQMGARYAIDSLVYKINGEPVYSYFSKDVQDLPLDQRKPKDFETKLVSGPHLFEVQVIYKGSDSGIFSYLRDYSVTREAKLNLVIDAADSTKIRVTTFEKGWIFTDFKERPQLKVESSSQIAKN